MTPDRAATIFRELLQTPESELGHLPRRMGLPGNPTPPDLQQAKDLLDALVVALQSGPGPNWDRVNTAWGAMLSKHGKLDKSAMGYSQPAWIRDLPPKPTLGDPAPGSPGYASQQEQRQRYVPPSPQQHAAPQQPAVHAAPQQPVVTAPQQPAVHAAPQQAIPQQGGHQAGYPPPPGLYSPPAGYAPPAIQVHGATPSPPPAQASTAQASAPPQPPPPPQRSAPPAPAPSEGDIQSSVAKYAAFCAACAAHPDRVFTTQVEYGITSPQMREQLDEDWQDRFDDDAELHARWEQLFQHFRKQLG